MHELRELTPDDLTWTVNWYATRCREASGSGSAPYPDARDVTGDLPVPLADIVRVADRLWEVFASRDESIGAHHLNDLLDHAAVSPRVSPDGQISWWSRHDSPDELFTATAAVSLANAIHVHGWKRLGVCAASDCSDVYIAQTKRNARRYCSPKCLNRSRVRDFRSRQAQPN